MSALLSIINSCFFPYPINIRLSFINYIVLGIEAFKSLFSTTIFYLLNNLFLIPQNLLGFEIIFCIFKKLTIGLNAILVTANCLKIFNFRAFLLQQKSSWWSIKKKKNSWENLSVLSSLTHRSTDKGKGWQDSFKLVSGTHFSMPQSSLVILSKIAY